MTTDRQDQTTPPAAGAPGGDSEDLAALSPEMRAAVERLRANIDAANATALRLLAAAEAENRRLGAALAAAREAMLDDEAPPLKTARFLARHAFANTPVAAVIEALLAEREKVRAALAAPARGEGVGDA